MNFSYYIPTKILFGKGQLSQLHQQALPGKKALIVTTAGTSVKKYGYLRRLQEQLDQARVEYVVFDKIPPNPIKAHVMEGAQLARQTGCDFVIGLGGGSSIDSAKSIAMMATNEGDYWDYISGGSGKGLPMPNAPLPIVAVTTTAGTGTESDPWTVITNEFTNEKIGWGYELTFPVLSIVDPELMMTVPKDLTAYQGFDALFHSTEGYLNNTATPISDMYALKSIELIGQYLAQAVNEPSNEEARANVALANTIAGFVESTSGCTSEHSIEHALSAFHPQLPHGAGLIMVSEAYYTHFAESGACDRRMIQMARALGREDARHPMGFVRALIQLQEDCDVRHLKMSDYGIRLEDTAKYVANAREAMGGLFQFDPAPLSDADVASILKKSYR
ncbi:MAG: iron-containing alcohol dehydrogenase [Chloroflexi bacterium]|nr:iron-containing alcohol dehydrogenase [Chloroflexota bacterium]